MTPEQRIKHLQTWLDSLEVVRANQGPARGTIAGALVVLEHLKSEFDLTIAAHLAPKGTQIKGASGRVVEGILAALGEKRPYLSEGGRTNRGLLKEIKNLLRVVGKMNLGTELKAERAKSLTTLQILLTSQVRAFHDRQRIKLNFDPAKSTDQLVGEILSAARESAKEGPVAQHIVGAKLQLRYPALKIENNHTSTADTQLGRAGDFLVGDTAFHITVAPMPSVFDKCRKNLAAGMRAYLIVPKRATEAARQMAGDDLLPRISVVSLESFVSQNIDEIGEFRAKTRNGDFARLVAAYNERVDAVESDKSLLIEVPRNLRLGA